MRPLPANFQADYLSVDRGRLWTAFSACESSPGRNSFYAALIALEDSVIAAHRMGHARRVIVDLTRVEDEPDAWAGLLEHLGLDGEPPEIAAFDRADLDALGVSPLAFSVEEPESKTCPRCGQCKDVGDFFIRDDGRRQSYCRPCAGAASRETERRLRAARPGQVEWEAAIRQARRRAQLSRRSRVALEAARPAEKACRHCGQTLPSSAFYLDPRRLDTLTEECRSCSSEGWHKRAGG